LTLAAEEYLVEPNSDASSPQRSRPAPKPDTTILHLDKLAPGVPQDGSEDESMTGFIAKAAAQTVQESSKPVVVPKEGGPVPPESMLGVVSYCYAKGIYGSKEIGRKMAQDPVFRAACKNEVPRPEDIRRFRRLNRDAILKTLEKVLQFARTRVAEAWSPVNPFRSNAPASSAARAPEPAKPVAMSKEDPQTFARREASDRLDRATFIDGMSM
jgi:hypothetical protein